jgi:hypothetical protein
VWAKSGGGIGGAAAGALPPCLCQTVDVGVLSPGPTLSATARRSWCNEDGPLTLASGTRAEQDQLSVTGGRSSWSQLEP